MDNVLAHLKKLSNEVDLSKRFTWDFNGDFLNSIPQVGRSINHSRFHNPFERNEMLKFKLTEYFQQNNASSIDDLHFWIINKWGGIGAFKKNDENRNKIMEFKDQIKKGRLAGTSFEKISSFSKLSSFWDCKKYAIYDSKVIFSLNWLVLKLANDKKYFPMPEGRNKVIVDYKIGTIIRLFHKDKKDNELFYNVEEAYHRYCYLIREWSSNIWDNDYLKRRDYPFYLEMILFVISDKEIFEDMKKCINIKIETG